MEDFASLDQSDFCMNPKGNSLKLRGLALDSTENQAEYRLFFLVQLFKSLDSGYKRQSSRSKKGRGKREKNKEGNEKIEGLLGIIAPLRLAPQASSIACAHRDATDLPLDEIG